MRTGARSAERRRRRPLPCLRKRLVLVQQNPPYLCSPWSGVGFCVEESGGELLHPWQALQRRVDGVLAVDRRRPGWPGRDSGGSPLQGPTGRGGDEELEKHHAMGVEVPRALVGGDEVGRAVAGPAVVHHCIPLGREVAWRVSAGGRFVGVPHVEGLGEVAQLDKGPGRECNDGVAAPAAVEYLWLLGYQQVARLHVAVHYLAVVDVRERLGDVEPNRQDRVGRHRQPVVAGHVQHVIHRPRHALHEQHVQALWR